MSAQQPCTDDFQCYDGNDCTADVCDNGTCAHNPASYFTPCAGDGNDCTIDACNAGVCTHVSFGGPGSGCCPVDGVPCDDNDGIACTEGICESFACIPVQNHALCDDGNGCTFDVCEVGEPVLGCVHEPNPLCCNCDDGNSCTTDTCVFGTCYNFVKADNAPCAADNYDCTRDFCSSGECIHVLDESLCVDDGNICTTDFCDNGNCNHEIISGCCQDDAQCEDGDTCTTNVCYNGTCYTIPRCCVTYEDCNDRLDCTSEECYDGLCVVLPAIPELPCTPCQTDAECDDGDICLEEYCDFGYGSIEGHCQTRGWPYPESGTPCGSDNDPCTKDYCDEQQCHRLICIDWNSCTTDFCDNGVCSFEPVLGCCRTDADCDDDDACNIDFCYDDECFHRAVACIDNNICTADFCDSISGCQFIDQSPVANAGADKAVYIGYSPARCATLTATATGNGPFTFAWSNGATTASVNVCPTATTTYCVTVTDANGCSDSDCAQVCAYNIRCTAPAYNQKVYICHKKTRSAAGQTQCVASSAVAAHLAHGDLLGPCNLVPCLSVGLKTEMDGSESFIVNESVELIAYPNPFSENLNIEFTLAEDTRVKLEIFNLAGQKIATLFEGDVKASELQKFEYHPTSFSDGMIIYRLQTAQGIYYDKAVMVK